MTEADREMLGELRAACEQLGKMCRRALDKGFLVQFNINNGTGEVDVFKVTQMVEVDLSGRNN